MYTGNGKSDSVMVAEAAAILADKTLSNAVKLAQVMHLLRNA